MEIVDKEQQCCGSGCTNCVLDLKPANHKLPAGVINVFDRTYQRFVCCWIAQETEHVFRFRLRLETIEHAVRPDGLTKRLMVPPGCHLFLRAPKLTIGSCNPSHDRLIVWREQNLNQLTSMEHIERRIVEKYDKNEDDLYFCRPYTPISHDHAEGTFDVLIKMEPGGKMTEYLSRLSIGSLTEWKGVYGDFDWARNKFTDMVGFVQGVAIAPVYSTMKAILDDEEDYTRLTLCACFRNLQNVLLRDELLSMADYWNFRYEAYLSRRDCKCSQDEELHCDCITRRIKYKEPIYDRRLEANDIDRLLEPFAHRTNSLLVLVCGTDNFTLFIKSNLARLGIENWYIF